MVDQDQTQHQYDSSVVALNSMAAKLKSVALHLIDHQSVKNHFEC